jgi:hypothetical protein
LTSKLPSMIMLVIYTNTVVHICLRMKSMVTQFQPLKDPPH